MPRPQPSATSAAYRLGRPARLEASTRLVISGTISICKLNLHQADLAALAEAEAIAAGRGGFLELLEIDGAGDGVEIGEGEGLLLGAGRPEGRAQGGARERFLGLVEPDQ